MIPTGKHGQMKPSSPMTLGNLLKGNLAVLATLIAFCGLVSTEAYSMPASGCAIRPWAWGPQQIAY